MFSSALALILRRTLRLLTPPIETPDPPSDTPGASKQVVLTPHDIPRILRETNFFELNMDEFPFPSKENAYASLEPCTPERMSPE